MAVEVDGDFVRKPFFLFFSVMIGLRVLTCASSHLPDNKGVNYQVFLRALYNYAKVEMRLGR